MSYVFVADDDDLVTALIEFRLKRLGHTVATANDGETAIAEVFREPPDLVILDYQMPIVSAPEIIERLKADPATADVPVFVLAAAWREQDVLDALDSGITDYMTKPFSPDELMKRIERILERAQGSDP